MFQTSPGYQFAMDQGLNAIDRRAASRGMLGSGNTNIDTLKFATGLGNQEWGNYLNRLQGLSGQGFNAAGATGNLYQGLGTGLNNSYANQGQQAYNMQTGIGNANAGAEVAKANAETAASGNLWGGLLGAATAAAKFSDRRLKCRITRLGSVGKYGWYLFSYIWAPWKRHVGVMADEVERINPGAVLRHWTGFKMVEYGKL